MHPNFKAEFRSIYLSGNWYSPQIHICRYTLFPHLGSRTPIVRYLFTLGMLMKTALTIHFYGITVQNENQGKSCFLPLLESYRPTMWICIHKGENRNLKCIPELSDQKSCIKIWYASSLRKQNKADRFKLIKTTSGYIYAYICQLKRANKTPAGKFLQ